jgi:tetratricopeptide (TPR) repeat protein
MRNCYASSLENAKQTDEALRQSAGILDTIVGPGRWENYADVPTIVNTDPSVAWRLVRNDGFARKPYEDIATQLALRGHLLRAAMRDGEAKKALKAAAALDPLSGRAWLELGQMARGEDNVTALKDYRRAWFCNPKDSVAATLVAKMYHEAGQTEREYAVLSRVPEMHPEFGEALLDLAEMQIDRKEFAKANKTLSEAATTIVDAQRMAKLRGRANMTSNDQRLAKL